MDRKELPVIKATAMLDATVDATILPTVLATFSKRVSRTSSIPAF